MNLNVDGEGFLVDPNDWTNEAARQIATNDGRDLTDEHMAYIEAARKMFHEQGIVPPLRKFCKAQNVSKADLFISFETGPMKLICKWGGLPKPTGCV